MTNDGSFADRVAGAARDAWLGVEAATIIASSPAGIMQDNNIQLADPVMNSGISALAENHEALSSIIGGRTEAEELAEATDVSQEPTTSLIVDPPAWMANPTDLQDSINNDLASWPGDEGAADLGSDRMGEGIF